MSLRTGQVTITAALGEGVVMGPLAAGVHVGKGEDFTIAPAGAIERGDGHRRPVFGLSTTAPWQYAATGTATAHDMPSAFVRPHPHYAT